jgi:hypothetical protein
MLLGRAMLRGRAMFSEQIMTCSLLGLKPGYWLSLLLCAVLCSQSLAAEPEYPAQAKDLLYGEALYKYYQGESFEALTLLNVAKTRGGVKGHADHPLLVEGGLLLAYGMVKEAQTHFESVLAAELEARVPAGVRNQAWFYLGKVHYLGNDLSAAKAAFTRLDIALLSDESPNNYEELLYLQAQISLKSSASLDSASTHVESFSEKSLWAIYIKYNKALLSRELAGDDATTVEQLESVLRSVQGFYFESDEDKREQALLADRIRLTLGQLYLEKQGYGQAAAHLKKVAFDSPFSEQSLFNYAVAMAHQEEYSLALSALNRLRDSRLFTPWLQQVPYALAYLYEQMGEQELALQAYQSAGAHYDHELEKLAQQQTELSEEKLLDTLVTPLNRSINLGAEHIENDAYGRINVRPLKFGIAELLSGERFQWGLRDLHELYKLEDSLAVWDSRLVSFELMLETREAQRNERLSVVKKELEAQRASRWIGEQKRYQQAIKSALAEENLTFFMDEAQMEFAEQIAGVKRTLAVLPSDEDTDEYQRKLARVESYFDWWVADSYGVNRWAAQSQMKQLDGAMNEFLVRHTTLKNELSNGNFQESLVVRVEEAKVRLADLRHQLGLGLESVRVKLLEQMREAIEEQGKEVSRYRLASRHAQARIADLLYRLQEEAPSEPEVTP